MNQTEPVLIAVKGIHHFVSSDESNDGADVRWDGRQGMKADEVRYHRLVRIPLNQG